MKKLFASLSLILILLSLLLSCGKDGKEADGSVTYYGSVVYIEELNNTCVFIPGIGEVELPRLEDKSAPTIKRGDLVRIRFDSGNDLSIMESYPARFGAFAAEIEVKNIGLAIERVGDEYRLYGDIPKEIGNLSLGEELLIAKKNGESEKEILRGQIVSLTDKTFSLTLDRDTELSILLKELFSSSITIKTE